MATLDELRQILQSGEGSSSLFTHLQEVLLHIFLEKPTDAYETFEHISASVKQQRAQGAQSAGISVSPEQRERQLEWASANAALLKTPDEKPEGFPRFPDLMDEAAAWAWAGVSFGREETYRLYLSIKKLAEGLSPSYESLRFWGKISTRTGGYFVVEGRTFEDEEFDVRTSEGKDGANKYTYWVTRSATEAWHQLPHVTQQQIVVARHIKHLFMGDLDADVQTFPPFPGTEKNLLRAQIARITAATCVSPEGYFELEEDAEVPTIKVVEAEALAEKFPKAMEDLKSAEGWVHHELELNVLGRKGPMPLVTDEEGNETEDPNEPEAVPPLRALSDDAPEGDCWSFRVCPGGAGEAKSSLVVARSLLWPGAYALAFGRKFLNVYVGSGNKYTASTYTPPPPRTVLGEWAPAEQCSPLSEQADITQDPTPSKEGQDEEE